MSLIKYSPFADFEAFPSGMRLFQDSVNRLLAVGAPGRHPGNRSRVGRKGRRAGYGDEGH